MHELSVCQSLLDQVESIAHDRGAVSVERIVLKIGCLSGIEAELLKRAFTIARAGTMAEGASLEIELVPIQVACQRCGAQTEAKPNFLLCGECGDWHTRIVQGDEMLLARVELAMKKEAPCAGSAVAM